MIDGASCFNFEIEGLVVLYDDFHFILNFHKHIHVRMKRAFDTIPGVLQVFSFAARSFFGLARKPPMPIIIAAYLNNVFEEIHQLAIQHDQEVAWQHLREVSALVIRIKLYWFKLYVRQDPRGMALMKSDVLLAISSFSFPPYSLFARKFKISLVNAFNYFKNPQNQQEAEISPIHNLTLFPLEGLLEGFKLIRMYPQPLTRESVTANLQFLSRGAISRYEHSSCLNGVVIFTPNHV